MNVCEDKNVVALPRREWLLLFASQACLEIVSLDQDLILLYAYKLEKQYLHQDLSV